VGGEGEEDVLRRCKRVRLPFQKGKRGSQGPFILLRQEGKRGNGKRGTEQ